jgi:dipeptidyl aminopeptidase/acylaminoacyl peptidase
MKIYILISILILSALHLSAQNKKPLTHDVYDGWKSFSEAQISNNGNIICYQIAPQEGDGNLYIYLQNNKKQVIIARGYNATISYDNEVVVCKIKPYFKDSRQARIKKKRPDEMPKDSLAIYYIAKDSLAKIAQVKSYKLPEKAGQYIAYHLEKQPAPKATKDSITIVKEKYAKVFDSIVKKSLDSVKGKVSYEKIMEAAQKASQTIIKSKLDELFYNADAEGDGPTSGTNIEEGTTLVVLNYNKAAKEQHDLVNEYYFSENANVLLIEKSKNNKDSLSKATVNLKNLENNTYKTIFSKFNDAKNYTISKTGQHIAFTAERDSSAKALQKFYALYTYKANQDSANLAVNYKDSKHLPNKYAVSENRNPVFSDDEQKLWYGIATVKPIKDTNLVDFETARLDVWNYNDDYLQPQQLKQLDNELKRSDWSIYNLSSNQSVRMGRDTLVVYADPKNPAQHSLGTSNKAYRKEQQWTAHNTQDIYLISQTDGKAKLIAKAIDGNISISPNGKYVYWYDDKKRNYFVYNTATEKLKNISALYPLPLFDEENDMPDYPNAYGVMGWTANDEALVVYDRYTPIILNPETGSYETVFTSARKNKEVYRYLNTNKEERHIDLNSPQYFAVRSEINKTTKVFLSKKEANNIKASEVLQNIAPNFNYNFIGKAKNSSDFLVSKTSFSQNEILVYNSASNKNIELTNIKAQQDSFNWLNASLVKWKMLDGKISEGILYKPENFDSTKKYPILFYFYERNADNLHRYIAPAPTASTINIAMYTSNGYLVFDPNIYYKDGQPGQSAYNSVVSAAKYFAKQKWIDSTKMGIQGQSWGGYQVAYLVTQTKKLFAAAGAGAPVANMTSAYGGIRWGSGISRQFQYEKSQSRLGATLWEKPELYLKNSPLFLLNKVQTPLLIMHNDSDGAVPWYQGIELFTGLKRLNKPSWLLQYNGEDHNLVERRNRKDLSIRLQQFFDHYLKGAPAPTWMTTGVPATLKGIDWGTK